MIGFLIWFVLLFLVFVGVPIGASMGISAIIMLMMDNPANSVVIAQKAVNGLDSFTLLAIPFFMLAANIMTNTGVGNRIFRFANSCVRHIPGGLAQVNILASVIMAGMSGAAICDITGIGKLEIDAMTDAGYDKDFSCAVTASSSALGPIIPPSIPMVLVGSIMGVSISKMLIGGIVPGLLMVVAMSALSVVISKKRAYPVFPRAKGKELWTSLLNAFPALLMPVILLGGIFSGLATPTEAACLAVLYAVFLGFVVYRNLNLKKLFKILEGSALLCANTMFIVACAAIFGLIITQQQIPQKITALFLSVSNNKYVVLFMINILLLILGCMLETNSIYIILTPILMQVANSLGIDLIHFGVMMCFNVTLALYTPPVGMGMYLTCRIGGITTGEFIKSIWPFMLVLIVALMVVTYVPGVVTLLPGLLH